MKVILIKVLSLTLLFALNSHAAEVEIDRHLKRSENLRGYSNIGFRIDHNSNKVWVEFNRVIGSSTSYRRITVPGLKYSNTTKEITLDTLGNQIVCSRIQTLKKRRKLKIYLRNTGDCKFKQSINYKRRINKRGYRVQTANWVLKLSY